VETVTPAKAAGAHRANKHTMTNTDFGIKRNLQNWFLAFGLSFRSAARVTMADLTKTADWAQSEVALSARLTACDFVFGSERLTELLCSEIKRSKI
jgi:hypothetical protein